MEGRHPPPKATDALNVPFSNKFWGTPMTKAFFKCSLAFVAIMFSINGTNYYLTRNQEYILGFRVKLTPEEIEERRDLVHKKSALKSMSINLNMASDSIMAQDDKVQDPRLDDRVAHIIGASEDLRRIGSKG